MVKTAITIVIGASLAFFADELPERHWVSYFPILLLFAYLLPRYRFLLLLAAAFLWTSAHIYYALGLKLDPEKNNSVTQISGVIADIAVIKKQSLQFLFKPKKMANYDHILPALIRINWYQTRILPAAGEHWQLTVKLKRPVGFQNPGGFDYERWLLVKNIGATGYVKDTSFNRRLSPASRWDINHWRSQIGQSIDRYCVGCRYNGLIKALVFGYRGDIPKAQKGLLRDSGTAHLLAISGLHIGLVAGVFFVFGHRLWLIIGFRTRYNQLEFASTLAFIAGFGYAALAGFSLPTVRALIMLGVVFLALRFRTGINLLNSVSLAVVVILIFDPIAVGSSSFWLSICALIIIIYAQYLLSHQSGRWKQTLIVQVLFTIVFVPLSLVIFDQANPASFLANIIAIPVISLLVLPIALLASLCAVVGLSISHWLFVIDEALLKLLFGYIHLLLESGLASYSGSRMPDVLYLLQIVGLYVLLMPRGFVGKKPALMLVLLPLFWQKQAIEYAHYQMTLLDVGMGTSAVIQTQHHSLIYDFGPGNDRGFSVGELVLAPYLQYEGISEPDLLVVSHVDQDHSGGFISFRHQAQASQLLSGTPRDLEDKFQLPYSVRSCHRFPSWQWDGVQFEFLTAAVGFGQSENNRSCVLKISGFHTSILPGDIEVEQEYRLVEKYGSYLRSNLLVAPHHGSRTSSTLLFVAAVNPESTLFTIGRDNRWGFPRQPVVDRYISQGSAIYRTDIEGAITVDSSEDGLKIGGQRRDHHRFWF